MRCDNIPKKIKNKIIEKWNAAELTFSTQDALNEFEYGQRIAFFFYFRLSVVALVYVW